MTEDIVERLRATAADAIAWEGETMKRWDNIRAMLMHGDKGDLPRLIFESIMDGHAEEMQEAATTIETLRAQLSTEHALGFKAGIEAGVEVAMSAINVGNGEAKSGMARAIARQISSLPTPPSMLPEILEAMRPFAVEAVTWEGDDGVRPSFSTGWGHPIDAKFTVADLRAIAAMFTKLGGTHD